MIRTYRVDGGKLRAHESDEGVANAGTAIWIDLYEPTQEEEKAVEAIIGADIPTREEMAEIEKSSRLYTVDGAAIMTAPLAIRSTGDYPATTQVTFVLTSRQLVTVRYAEPVSFATFQTTLKRDATLGRSPQRVFAGLLDAIIDRLADMLEITGGDLDALGRSIFTGVTTAGDLKAEMQRLGRDGEVVSKASESLVGLALLLTFARGLEAIQADKEIEQKLQTVSQDIDVLLQHTNWQTSKSQFLLEAMLGMINIEQNALIKIFSVVAVVFLPPTLIASIYGMNFEHMPEVDWVFGYPLALAAMAVSMVVPYLVFRRKGWI